VSGRSPAFEPPSAARSRNMAAIRGRNTQPELAVRQALFRAGFRYRLHRPDLPRRPDIVLPRYRRIVLVHGCFWHGHGCHRALVPKTNTAYWIAKISANRERDRRSRTQLEAEGWRVTTLWTCDLTSQITALVEELQQERQETT